MRHSHRVIAVSMSHGSGRAASLPDDQGLAWRVGPADSAAASWGAPWFSLSVSGSAPQAVSHGGKPPLREHRPAGHTIGLAPGRVACVRTAWEGSLFFPRKTQHGRAFQENRTRRNPPPLVPLLSASTSPPANKGRRAGS